MLDAAKRPAFGLFARCPYFQRAGNRGFRTRGKDAVTQVSADGQNQRAVAKSGSDPAFNLQGAKREIQPASIGRRGARIAPLK